VYDQLTATTAAAAAAAGDIARIVAVADSYTTPINYIILVSLSLSLSSTPAKYQTVGLHDTQPLRLNGCFSGHLKSNFFGFCYRDLD